MRKGPEFCRQENDIEEFGLSLAKVFAGRSPLHADLLKDADFRKPDIVFDKEYDLDLGGVTARVPVKSEPLSTEALWLRPGARGGGGVGRALRG